MENIDKKTLSEKILRIMNDCDNIDVKQQLQLIYDRLNENHSLKPVNLLQRLKNAINMLNPQYKKQLETIKISSATRELEDIINTHIITENLFQNQIIENCPSQLGATIDTFLDLNLGIEFDENNNTLKRYDINLTDNTKKLIYSELLTRMQSSYFNENISLKDLTKHIEDQYKHEIQKIKDKAKTMDIEPYYGNKEFMEYRISFIKNCIERMLEHPKFQGRKNIEQNLHDVQQIYQIYQSTSIESDSIEKQKKDYEQLEALYKQTIEIEDTLSKDVEQVWIERMNEKNSTKGQMAYFAHVLTNGEFNPEDMDKVCVTYATEQTLTLPYGDYGFIYTMDMQNIVQLSSEDAGSWKISKQQFIEQDLCTSWQFTEPINKNGDRIFFEYPPKNSKLLLPDDVEKSTIDSTIKYNGEMLNYDKCIPYNEAVVINKDKKMMPIAVFVKTFGNEDYTEKVQKAKALSEKLGIPLKEFDITSFRENLGLKPFTDGELKKFSQEK